MTEAKTSTLAACVCLLLSIISGCVIGADAFLPSVSLNVNGSKVTATFVNHIAQPITLLKWGTPLEDILTQDAFEIKDDATTELLPYVGMMVKRGDPDADSFVEIAAGQSVAGQADLAQSYELEAGHSYSVRFNGKVYVSIEPLATRSTLPAVHDLHSSPISLSLQM